MDRLPSISLILCKIQPPGFCIFLEEDCALHLLYVYNVKHKPKI